MRKYVVITDSASDVPEEYVKKYNIKIVPLYIYYNGKEYKDGIDITSEQVYTLQKEKGAIFTSSCPSPHDFVEIYKKLLKKYEKIISIHVSSKLSAVIKSARVARDLLKAEERIKIFDSLSGTVGTGFMTIVTAKTIINKYCWEKIISVLEFVRSNTKIYGTINTLKYLKRSGRVPAIANIVTTGLKIKPILCIEEGLAKMIGIALTRHGSLVEIAKRVVRDFKKAKWVFISMSHALSSEESRKVTKKIQPLLNCVGTIITDCTPVVGAHTGPGLIVIAVSSLNQDIAELFI